MDVQCVDTKPADNASKTEGAALPPTKEEKRERVFLPTRSTDGFSAILLIVLQTLRQPPSHMLPPKQTKESGIDLRGWLRLMISLVR